MSDRSITFTIPGTLAGDPSVVVTATEQLDGSILIELEVIGGTLADIRGLFFGVNDSALVDTLQVVGADITNEQFADDDVSNLKEGVNVNGTHVDFDAGVAFGTAGIGTDDISSTSFSLSSSFRDLTLDDLANVDFGVRLTSVGEVGGDRTGSLKLTTISTAAPDAIDDAITTDEDTAISDTPNLLANDTDADGDTLTIIEVDGDDAKVGIQFALATGALLTVASDGTFDLDPDGQYEDLAVGENRTDSFTYRVFDNNGGFDTATADVTITGVNDAPTVANLSFGVNEDGPAVSNDFQGADVDSDDDRSTLTYIVLAPPAEGSLTNHNNSTFTFDPNGDFEDLALGESRQVSFTYKATDAHGAMSGSATGAITVQGANDSPVAQNVAVSVGEDGPGVTGSFNGSDVDTTDTLTFAIRSSPSRGSVVNNNDGTFTFSPDDDFQFLDQGQSRDVTFTYVAIDDSGAANDESALQTVTVTVIGAFDAPVQNQQEFLFSSVDQNPWGPGAAANFVSVDFLGVDSDPVPSSTTLIPSFVILPGFTIPEFTLVPEFTTPGFVLIPEICFPFFGCTPAVVVPEITVPAIVVPEVVFPDISTPSLGLGFDTKFLFGLQSLFGMTAGQVDTGIPYNVVFTTPFQAEAGQSVTVGSSFELLASSTLATATDTVGIDALGPNVRYELDVLADISADLDLIVGGSSSGIFDLGINNTFTEFDPLFGTNLRGTNIISFDATQDLNVSISDPAGILTVDVSVPNLDAASGIDVLNSNVIANASDPFLTVTIDLDAIVSVALGFGTTGLPFVIGASVDIGPFSGTAALDLADFDIVNNLTLDQDLTLNINDLLFDLFDESGTQLANDFSVGTDVTFDAADGGVDGFLGLQAVLDPVATLTNSTSLGFNNAFTVAFLEFILALEAFGVTLAEASFGPLASADFPIIDTTLAPLLDTTFDLGGFTPQTFDFGIDIA